MRGQVDDQPPLFHIFDVEARIRLDPPLRDVKWRTDRLLAGMSARFAVDAPAPTFRVFKAAPPAPLFPILHPNSGARKCSGAKPTLV